MITTQGDERGAVLCTQGKNDLPVIVACLLQEMGFCHGQESYNVSTTRKVFDSCAQSQVVRHGKQALVECDVRMERGTQVAAICCSIVCVLDVDQFFDAVGGHRKIDLTCSACFQDV